GPRAKREGEQSERQAQPCDAAHGNTSYSVHTPSCSDRMGIALGSRSHVGAPRNRVPTSSAERPSPPEKNHVAPAASSPPVVASGRNTSGTPARASTSASR